MRYTFIDDKNMNNWLPGKDIPALIKDIKNPVGIEIGTAEGYTTKYLLSTIPNLKLYGIDPYISFQDISGVFVDYDTNGVFENFTKMTSEYKDRYFHFRKTSDEAVNYFDDETIDFVFVDGLHVYDQVLKDCQNYYSRVKKGGLFCGHDWSMNDVKKAVTEFSELINLNKSILNAEQDLWYWYKD